MPTLNAWNDGKFHNYSHNTYTTMLKTIADFLNFLPFPAQALPMLNF
jgi:hypothetical protein